MLFLEYCVIDRARFQRVEQSISRACLVTHPADGIGHLLDEDVFRDLNRLYGLYNGIFDVFALEAVVD
jgi:hypothetical protein